MTNMDEIDDIGRRFLIQLFDQTSGDSAAQVSMYELGDLLGLDRETASRVAQELMGFMLIEIRTLSGGIGISTEGSHMVRKLAGPRAAAGGQSRRLGNGPVLDSADREAVEKAVSEVKGQTGSLGLDFDSLTELMADLKTIDAQLGSTRPKTEIVRQCFYSVLEILKGSEKSDLTARIRDLAGGKSS